MGVLSETIRLRAPLDMVRAAEAWAYGKGETISGMIRRLLAAEVPGLPGGDPRGETLDEAALVADVLAGVTGAEHRLLLRAATGTAEQRNALLRVLVGYLVWEYRAPPDPASLADMVQETHALLAGVAQDERERGGAQ